MQKDRVDISDVYIVIPALNEESRVYRVIDALIQLGFKHIILVDDGSTDRTAHVGLSRPYTTVLNHIVNLGPGASTMTGIQFSVEKNAKYIATIDADNQHDPIDLLALVREIDNSHADLVIGSRFLQQNAIPWMRIGYNHVGNWISYFKTGLRMTDSQSGLKIMTHSFAKKLTIDYNGFEFCIDIIKKARLHKVYVSEIPISVQYTKETLAKGQSFINGLLMLGKLLNPFR